MSINQISVIVPCEESRLDLFKITFSSYLKYGIPENFQIEFLLISRSIKDCPPIPNTRLIKYEYFGEYFNPSKAFNIGIREALYENVLIISPEVKPVTDIIGKFSTLERGNYVCSALDQQEDGKISVLVNSQYRSETPAMYFTALFKKEDILDINGWDENFCSGIAWEDDDFGARFVGAGKKFEILEDCKVLHMWHPRNYMNVGWDINRIVFEINRTRNIIRCPNGIIKEPI